MSKSAIQGHAYRKRMVKANMMEIAFASKVRNLSQSAKYREYKYQKYLKKNRAKMLQFQEKKRIVDEQKH